MLKKRVTVQRLMSHGDYLGFDENKGYMYSIFLGYGKSRLLPYKEVPMQGVYSVKGHVIEHLITYPLILQED